MAQQGVSHLEDHETFPVRDAMFVCDDLGYWTLPARLTRQFQTGRHLNAATQRRGCGSDQGRQRALRLRKLESHGNRRSFSTYSDWRMRTSRILHEASHDYEQALSLLGHDASAVADRAAVLDDYGALYRDQGQLDVAIRLRLQALDLYRSINNHEGTAIASNNLAALYLAQKHTPRRNVTSNRPLLRQSLPRIWMRPTGPRLRRT